MAEGKRDGSSIHSLSGMGEETGAAEIGVGGRACRRCSFGESRDAVDAGDGDADNDDGDDGGGGAAADDGEDDVDDADADVNVASGKGDGGSLASSWRNGAIPVPLEIYRT